MDKILAELAAAEASFADAVVHNDLAALGEIVTEDWVIVDPDGTVIDRTRFFEVIRSGALTHTAMQSEQTRIRVYGDTAVVTALTKTEGAFLGKAFATVERATDVFARCDGRWRCVLTHLTRCKSDAAVEHSSK